MASLRDERAWIAVDLGAASGRVVLARLVAGGFALHVVHRFPTPQSRTGGRLRWSFDALWSGVRSGLARAATLDGLDPRAVASIGVDSWGVDYGWLDARGELLADPVCYRDERTRGMAERLYERVPRAEISRRTGIQHLPFNTLFQLFAETELGERPRGAARMLLIPDLVHQRLCGVAACERTNASTTQMLALATRRWDTELARAAGVDPAWLPELVDAPARLGVLDAELARALALPQIPIVAPAAHDTASAVAGTPLEPGWAYVSSGTWSLVGVELEHPIASERAIALGVTNEAGVLGTTRLLKNVMGLWIAEQCRAQWRARGIDASWDALLAGASPDEPGELVLDPDDERFLAPADMEHEVRDALGTPSSSAPAGRSPGAPEPRGPEARDLEPRELARAVLVSLALRYAEVVDGLESLIGRPIPGVHVVGGGSRNAFLNQATANACRRPVLAGPVEATALGNALLQALGDGTLPDLAAARALATRSFPPRRYEPRAHERWADARARFARHAAGGR